MDASSQFAVAVMTAPRKVDYSTSAIRSIGAAGFKSLHISRDGYAGVRLGIVPHFRLTLCKIHRMAPWSIVFQDDVTVARGLSVWLPENLPGHGVVSLYTSTKHDGPDGWNRMDLESTNENPLPWHNSVGACALMMPQDVAEAYLSIDPPVRTDRLGANVAEFCFRNGIPFWTHSPSLVQHVGVESCREGMPFTGDRVAKRFLESVGSAAVVEEAASLARNSRELEAMAACVGNPDLAERGAADTGDGAA